MAYARARHLEYQQPDGTWETDPRGDLGRIPRQQQFAKLLIHKALGNGIRNPGKALGVANSVIDVVKIDQQLSVQQLVDVGSQFRTFSSDQLKTYPLPTSDYTTESGAYQKVEWDDARQYLRVFQGLETGQRPVPRDVIVDVIGDTEQNTTAVMKSLGNLGFDASTMVDDTSRDVPLITYGPLGASGALLVARAIDGPVELRSDDAIEGQRVLVELGDLTPTVPDELRAEADVDPEVLIDLAQAGATTDAGENPPSTMGDPNTTEPGEGTTTVPEATSTTVYGEDSPPEPGLVGSESNAIVPIDYERSLACSG